MISNKILTVAICSNRLDKLTDFSLPLLKQLQNFCKMKILLDGAILNGEIDDSLELFYDQAKEIGEIEIIPATDVKGHSNLRNLALNSCSTKYLLFLDDDIVMSVSAVKAIIDELENGSHIVGLPLVSTEYKKIKKWYLSPNQYHYLALHTNSTLNSVWGACMAFDIEPIKKQKLSFDTNLGRQHNKFLSGEDTTFIARLKDQGCKSKVLSSHSAIHKVDISRLYFINLLKRVFWQGITEAFRNNVINGFVKEASRNFAVLTLANFLLGCFWMLIFAAGCFYGVFYKTFGI